MQALLLALLLSQTLTAQPSASDPPKIWIAQESSDEAVIYTLTLDDGRVFRTATRRDGICPFGCNSTMLFEIPSRGIREVFRGATGERSTGQLEVDLVPITP